MNKRIPFSQLGITSTPWKPVRYIEDVTKERADQLKKLQEYWKGSITGQLKNKEIKTI